jgi:hypothetical protein
MIKLNRWLRVRLKDKCYVIEPNVETNIPTELYRYIKENYKDFKSFLLEIKPDKDNYILAKVNTINNQVVEYID